MKASVLILTFNEAGNLPDCLAALSWCDDIVVLDSGSTDETVAIAEATGARVLTRSFDDFATQRNFGLEEGELRYEWVLHLDADEIVSDGFAKALADLEPGEGLDAWRVSSKTILNGRWLRHAGMWPTYQVRLGHSRRLRFVQVGHGQREALPPERVGLFPEPLIHNAFSNGMENWLRKHVGYARDEAAAIDNADGRAPLENLLSSDTTTRRRAAKSLAAALPPALRPLARFLYIYLVRLGFLDGRGGLAYAIMMATYEGMVASFLYEIRSRRP